MRKLFCLIAVLSYAAVLSGCGAGSNPTSDEKPLIGAGAKGAKGGATTPAGAGPQ